MYFNHDVLSKSLKKKIKFGGKTIYAFHIFFTNSDAIYRVKVLKKIITVAISISGKKMIDYRASRYKTGFTMTNINVILPATDVCVAENQQDFK